MSLMRTGQRTAFTRPEMARLKAVAPVVTAAAARNWRHLGRTEPRAKPPSIPARTSPRSSTPPAVAG
jgi:hypothetical protein